MKNPGQEFFEKSSYTKNMADADFPQADSPNRNIVFDFQLPIHNHHSHLENIINNRRSKRQYDNKPITLNQLSYLLWSTQGITATKGNSNLRAVASAGNCHCFNTYIIPNMVEGLDKGLYLFNSVSNSLGLVKSGDLSTELTSACLNQKMTSECAVCFVWTAVTPKMTNRYGLRGYRYMFIDAGHVGAHLQLACEDVGLGSCNIAAYMDDMIAELLGLETDKELPVYIGVAGWTK
jgi:SagB-type dehydrogenase family enzyme